MMFFERKKEIMTEIENLNLDIPDVKSSEDEDDE